MTNQFEGPQGEWERPVSTLDWFLTLLVVCIPFVNIIMLLVWAFGGAGQASKQNFARALLLWVLLSFALGIVFGILALLVGGGIATDNPQYLP